MRNLCTLFINLALCSSTFLLTGCSNMRLTMMRMEDNANLADQKTSNDKEITTGKAMESLLEEDISPEVLDEIKSELEKDPYCAFYACTLEAQLASSVALQQIDDLAKEALKRIELKKNGLKLYETNTLQPNPGIGSRGKMYTTYLILCVRYGFAKCITYLIKEIEVDINEQDSVGNAALHWAAEKLNLGTMRALIEAGGDVTLKNDVGWTCLHMLAKRALARPDELAYSKKNLQDFIEHIKNANVKSRASTLVTLVEIFKSVPRRGENRDQNFLNHPLFEGRSLTLILDYADKTDNILAIPNRSGETVNQLLS